MSSSTRRADESDVAAIVTAVIGEPPERVTALGSGVTSEGWRAETSDGPLAVLVELPDESRPVHARGTPANFESRHALLDRLHPLDGRVPRPLATNRSEGVDDPLEGALAWAVTELSEGTPFRQAGSPAEAARDLGGLLARLHALPVERYGMLEQTREALRGVADGLAEGILSRWPGLWPFDGAPLVAHPIVKVAPALLAELSALREQLLRYAEVDVVAVCHLDLHGEHILVSRGRLSGLFDFGDACIVPPAFDIASFAGHNGWPLAEALVEGYESNRIMREVKLVEAHQLAVALALQKVGKHTIYPDEVRMARALAFLEQTLPLALRRDA